MTKEQEEAIKYLEESILIYKNAIPKMSKAIETVLNILKQNSAELAEKSAEIEKYKYLYQKALDNTVKADRKNIQLKNQIDLMAEELVKAHEYFYSEFDNFTKVDFIQYFERKSEK